MPLWPTGVVLKFPATPPASARLARNDLIAVVRRDQLAEMSLVSLLAPLLTFVAGLWLRFRLGVGMFGTGRLGRVLRSQLLDFLGELLDLNGKRMSLLGQRLDLIDQRIDEAFDGRRHLGFDLGWNLDSGRSLGHATIGAENRRSRPDRFFQVIAPARERLPLEVGLSLGV